MYAPTSTNDMNKPYKTYNTEKRKMRGKNGKYLILFSIIVLIGLFHMPRKTFGAAPLPLWAEVAVNGADWNNSFTQNGDKIWKIKLIIGNIKDFTDTAGNPDVLEMNIGSAFQIQNIQKRSNEVTALIRILEDINATHSYKNASEIKLINSPLEIWDSQKNDVQNLRINFRRFRDR